MSCESCYNGCVQVTPDECVRYTGPDSVPLDIQTGDSLAVVEQQLISKVTSFLDGTGIKVDINPGFICPIVQTYLPITPDCLYTVPDYLTAVTRGICAVQDEIGILGYELSRLQGTYDVNCLVGVLPTDGTVTILQATINKLCQTAADLTALSLEVSTNYVKVTDLNSLIQAYLDSQSGDITQQYKKMVPYTAIEYYGPLSNFDGSGAGICDLGWDKVYLCNGANGTPDKRGRVGVGAIKNVPGGPLNPSVNPIYTGNPNYDLGDTVGINSVTLGTNNLPPHTHGTTVNTTVTDPGHTHLAGKTGENGGGGTIGLSSNPGANYSTSSSTTGISVNTTVAIGSTGSGVAHTNIQPVVAAYYIMYIP
jgi:microcystin-dependent protein